MVYEEIKIDVKEFLEEQSFDIKENNSNMIIFESCPKCSRENKLYVNPENGLYKCHYARCELHSGGNFVQFLMYVLDFEFKKAKKLVYDDDSSIFSEKKSFLDKLADKKKKELIEKIEIPKMLVDFDHTINPKGWAYLQGRGIKEEDLPLLNLKTISNQNYFQLKEEMRELNFSEAEIVYSCQFLNRVIFPLWVEGVMKGFMARDYTDKDKIKTKNAKGNYRSVYFWNYDAVKESELIVLCEGVFDAVKCGLSRSIAFLGTAFTEKQKNLLLKTKAKKIVICLDPGTEDIQKKIYKMLYIDYLDCIYAVNLPPYLYHKKYNFINKEFIKQVELLGNTKIKSYGDSWIIIDPKAREYLKSNSKGNKILIKDSILRDNFIKFFTESEFKDSGDYSKEEMSVFIDNAIKL